MTDGLTRRVWRFLIPAPGAERERHAYRFVRSLKQECLDRIIPLADGHFLRAVAEFIEQ